MAKKILLMDDSEITLEILKDGLEQKGFEVYTTTNLVEFDQTIIKVKPDLIITDIMMPDIKGDHICEVLKRDHHTTSTPIILFSSIEEEDLKALCKKSGADGYISKKSEPDEIVEKIKEFVDGIAW
jgi:DNA-binding response OmpR family regulator